MSNDTVPVVNLEVTVPHIILPTGKNRTGQMKMPSPGENQDDLPGAETEQVRLLPLDLQHNAQRLEQAQEFPITSEVPPRIPQKVRFLIFRIKDIPAQGQALLLQVLRRGSAGKKQQDKLSAMDDRPLLTSELAFSIEFSRAEHSSEVSPSLSTGQIQEGPLQAGMNRVVIYVDAEGVPGSYSIDGAES